MPNRKTKLFVFQILLTILNTIIEATICYPRDHLGHHESFCLLTLCRGPPNQFWSISSDQMRTLARQGHDNILERIWNIGAVRVVDATNLPPIQQTKSNDVVLINNANHGSAHLGMYFAFPAISITQLLKLNVVGIRHRLSNFDELAVDVPWSAEFVPLLHNVLLHVRTGTPTSNVHIHGFHHSEMSCSRSLLFHQVDMRGRFGSIEVLPRWYINQEIAKQTAQLVVQHTALTIRNDERQMLRIDPCQVVVILRESNLQGTSTNRRITNVDQVLKSLQTWIQGLPGVPVQQKYHVCRIYFDNTSLGFQVQVIRRASIVIAAHGAALTNVAWMRPCTILLELFPTLVWNHGMFKGLCSDVGCIYRQMSSTTMNREGCIKPYLEQYGEHAMKRECTYDLDCSGCSRDDSIQVDVDEMVLKLAGAWEERRERERNEVCNTKV
jgi:hypothetical protein